MSSWYRKGLRFACQRCGACCTGEPGAVWINEDELEALAAELGVDPRAFRRDWTHRIEGRLSLRERANGDCVFFDPRTRGCSVYRVRPVQCQTWPFWPQNLASEDDWEEAATACPGINRGDVVSEARIRARLGRLKRARHRDGRPE